MLDNIDEGKQILSFQRNPEDDQLPAISTKISLLLCSRLGAQQPATFFDPDNEEGKKARLHMAIAALDDMVEWLIEGGVVGIYDATNSTEARRYFLTH
jgi:hypothetical protein